MLFAQAYSLDILYMPMVTSTSARPVRASFLLRVEARKLAPAEPDKNDCQISEAIVMQNSCAGGGPCGSLDHKTKRPSGPQNSFAVFGLKNEKQEIVRCELRLRERAKNCASRRPPHVPQKQHLSLSVYKLMVQRSQKMNISLASQTRWEGAVYF